MPEQNQTPVAAFEVAGRDTLGSNEVVVRFDATRSFDDSAIADYVWDFGDATEVAVLRGDNGQFPSHTYLVDNAAVTVKLVVRDDDGEASLPASVRVRLAPNRTPTASFVASPTSGPAPLVVTFNASASSDPDPNETEILEYRWWFGDGSRETTGSSIIQHVYESAGSKRVTLRVSDGKDNDNGLSTPVYGEISVE